MKTKIKQLMCMVLAFVTSFTATVTAFAESINAGFNYYVGRYSNQSGSGYISVYEVSDDINFGLVVYRDDNHECYLTGRGGEGRIVVGKNGFDVVVPLVTKCDKDGFLPEDTNDQGQILEYKATGRVTKSIKTTIYSHQSSSGVYVK